uniref:Acyl-CoA thioesterase 9 n=1 Tax=Rhinolophus ferrumequinum TaxID=59479 RepID=A0A671DYU3_RHIFE
MEERKLLHSFLAKSQEGLPPRRMKDSYIEVLLPLGSQPALREKYLTFQNTIRFGRILEDLDSLGVLICYMHNKIPSANMSPLSIVTALVDKIDMCKSSLSPEQDIKFSGHVSWVGKTSMEVKMQMFQAGICKSTRP